MLIGTHQSTILGKRAKPLSLSLFFFLYLCLTTCVLLAAINTFVSLCHTHAYTSTLRTHTPHKMAAQDMDSAVPMQRADTGESQVTRPVRLEVKEEKKPHREKSKKSEQDHPAADRDGRRANACTRVRETRGHKQQQRKEKAIKQQENA